MDTSGILAWLVNGVPGATTAPEVLAGFSSRLLAVGVPLDRTEAFVRTLHPHIVGRSFVWRPGQPVEVLEKSYAYLQSREFLASPVAEVFQRGEYVRRRLTGAIHEREQPSLTPLAAEGYTDFFVAPLTFLSGQNHAVTFATRHPGGLTDEHLAAIRSVVPGLARIGEILALSRTAANLLNTYVGRNAGERILSGKIQRGDVDSIRAVIWFSDLRGFTSMASSLEPGALIRVLNDLFECQVPAIERHGGEVLKFIGDGLLAIFPVADQDRDVRERTESALAAAGEAYEALGALNARRTESGSAALRFGLALHVGDIAYGNIGGAGRLDFTCIGPAVNLASRLEGIASQLGENVVVSDELSRHTSRAMRVLGEFELKGVPGKQRALAPAA